MTIETIGLDIETASKDVKHLEYALIPQSADAHSHITSCAIYSNKVQMVESFSKESFIKNFAPELEKVKYVFVHNALFDMSWLMQSMHYTPSVFCVIDTLLFAKWIEPFSIRRHESFSLAALVTKYLREDFILHDNVKVSEWKQLKEEEKKAHFQTDNTLRYNLLDAAACYHLGEALLKKLMTGGDIERFIFSLFACMRTIPIFCRSYLNGIYLNKKIINAYKLSNNLRRKEIETELNLESDVLASPAKLGKVIFSEWGIPCGKFSDKTKKPSVSKNSLKAINDSRVQLISEWKELATFNNKFISASLESLEYNSLYDDKTRTFPTPRIFGTYTGRVTYNSKTLKYPTGIAIHQIPRNKTIRNLIIPPPGKLLVEFDASAQEMRLLAWLSKDITLVRLFNEGKDLHSYTGSVLAGVDYETFMDRVRKGDPKYAGEHGYRYCGKFINLSCQYRIGASKLAERARIDYGLKVDVEGARQFKDAYAQAYPGVKEYWASQISFARSRGYVDTLGHRRIHLPYGDKQFSEWELDSTAINFPIQGSGADMKEIAINLIASGFPQLEFYFDLHDGLWYVVDKPKGVQPIADLLKLLNDVKELLSEPKMYKLCWRVTPPIPIEWSAAVGTSMGNMVHY